MREASGPEPDATFGRLVYGSEQNIVIGRRVKQDKKAVARRPFSFRVMYANAQNILRRRGIVAITMLGAKTSVPYAGIRGRNENQPHTDAFRDPTIRRRK